MTMRIITVSILLALALHSSAIDTFVDNLVESLLDPSLKRASIRDADLDDMALGAPGHPMANARTSPISFAPLRSASGPTGVGMPIVPKSTLGVKAGSEHSYSFNSMAPVVSRGRGAVAVRAESGPEPGEEYELRQFRPLGVAWVKCADGGIYAKEVGRTADVRVQVGDQLLAVSASFGDEVWPASNYGQTMYAIRTRAGEVYLKLLSRGGDTTVFDAKADASKNKFASERAGGNYGIGTKMMQEKNFASAKELAKNREKAFFEALDKFKEGKFEEAAIDFGNVMGEEPAGYISDRNERVTPVYKASAYNLACCFSKLEQEDAGIEALKQALRAGFENYKLIRSDPNMEFIRQSRYFKPLIDQYDEPFINTEAFDAIKGLFR